MFEENKKILVMQFVFSLVLYLKPAQINSSCTCTQFKRDKYS